MAERYTKLFSLPENLYEKDCPVMICAGALSKDNQTNKVFVQLRFQNIDNRHRTIVAVKIAIQPLDVAENVLGNAKKYQYLDMNVERSAEAGGKQPILLDDNTARSFLVSILEVVFEDGSVWSGTAQNWDSLQQAKLSEKFNSDLMEQYQRDTFAEAEYEPLIKDGIWMCACGALNTIEDNKCCRCWNEKITQFAALEHNTLLTNFQMYVAKEQATQQKAAEKNGKKSRKATIICGIIGLVLCCCLALFSKPNGPNVVGIWSFEEDSNIIMTLDKDNTGKVSVYGEVVDIRWEYDEPSQKLQLTHMGTGEVIYLWYHSDDDTLSRSEVTYFGEIDVESFNRVND